MREHRDAVAVEEPPDFYGSAQPVALGEIDGRARVLVDGYLADHPGGTERLIPVLHLLQERLGHVPVSVQELVADALGLSAIQVFSVVTFYHFFTLTPRGRFPIKVCMGTACFVRHAPRLVETIQETLGIGIGGCTEDRMFSLEQVRCLGACGLAPAIMVGHDVHGNLDPNAVRRLIAQLRARGKREAAAQAREAAHE